MLRDFKRKDNRLSQITLHIAGMRLHQILKQKLHLYRQQISIAMQKITPHLWFDKEAKEAASFYTSVFPASRIINSTVIHDTPSGDCDIVSFDLWGQKFMSISAGPLFKFNPSVSFIVNFDPLFFKGSSSPEEEARKAMDLAWSKLSEGGNPLMPLDKYPFSERYGWIQDRFGLSWQLILTNPEGEPRPSIMPSLLFAGDKAGRAEEAIRFYVSIFKDSKMSELHRYGPDQLPDKEGTIMFADFMLENMWFAAMDSAREPGARFNEAISFVVSCGTQKEIDYYWEKLSAVPESEQCGWLKDKFGLSWQVVPEAMDAMMADKDPQRVARVTEAFLKMKKFDLAELERAYQGVPA
jgi:predicted 3-demethylubiquinone-9 3-methyltransferase (glyoxalase superfamily)